MLNKWFNITEEQDFSIDKAVEKLKKKLSSHPNIRVDRSTLIRLVLTIIEIDSTETIEKLAIFLKEDLSKS